MKKPTFLGTSVIHRSGELGIPPENLGSCLLILAALHDEDIPVLDALDNYNRERRIILLYEDMRERGLLRLALEEEEQNYYLTDKGTELVKMIYSKAPKPTTKQEAVDDVQDIMNFIWTRYPTTDNKGRLLRSNKQACVSKMLLFVNQHDYSAATIKEAIEQYCTKKEREGLNYIHTVSNLIMKNENIAGSRILNSALEDWCEQVVHADDDGHVHVASSEMI